MARKGRPPKRYADDASLTASLSPKKSTKKKKAAAAKGGGGRGRKKKRDAAALPASRTWIYAASSFPPPAADSSSSSSLVGEEGGGDCDDYGRYLHRRVRRRAVRTLPGNYSYFRPGVARADVDEKSEEGSSSDSEGEGDDEPDAVPVAKPHSLDCDFVPLPLEEAADATDEGKPSSAIPSYSEFCAPRVVKDSRVAKFKFSLNYSTHVPNRNLISYVGATANGDADGANESGYVLRMPAAGGTVVGYSPPLGEAIGEEGRVGEVVATEAEVAEFPTWRQRPDQALFRILWDGNSSPHDNNTCGGDSLVGYVEDVTLSELLPALDTGDSSSSLSSSSKKRQAELKQAQEAALSVCKHVHASTSRRQLALEWKVECEVLPHMVTLAALELRREVAIKARLEILLERKRLREASGLEKRGRNGKGGGVANRGEEVVNEDGASFGYYSRHPNQYMSSFTPPPPLPSDDEDSDGEEDEGEGSGRSKTRLTKDELARYKEKVEELCHFAPSKIAERIKAACSLAYEYAYSKGLLEGFHVKCERRNEREREERESSSSAGGRGRGGAGGGADAGEVRRSSRAKNSVNYAEDGTAYVEKVLQQREGEDAAEKSSSLSPPNESASGGPTALYLLELLGMLPEKEEASKMDDEEDEDEDEEEDDEDETDPFFEPDPSLILDQLGRKHRYMSPGAIQSAIVRAIEGEAADAPGCLLDEEEAEEMAQHEGRHYVAEITVTSDDKVEDLGQFEPASFARCRFATVTRPAESDDEGEDVDEHDSDAEGEESPSPEKLEQQRLDREASLRRKAERRLARKARERERNAELERAYRARKAFELWRFRSVHGDGCTVFPSWGERARELLRAMRGGDGGSSSAGVASSDEEGAPRAKAGASAGAVANGAASAAAGTEGPKSADGFPSAASVQDDEELARSLAAAEASDPAVDDADLPLAKRRRTTRRGAAAGSSSEPVFYGGHQSMSRDQLLETLVRLLKQASLNGGSSSLMDLKGLLFPDDHFDTSRGGQSEMRKLRSALGHLVYRLGRVGRLVANVEGDGAVRDWLREHGPLVKFVGGEDDVGGNDEGEAAEPRGEEDGVKSEVEPATMAAADGEDANRGIADADATSDGATPPPSPARPQAMDPHLKDQLLALEEYVAGLHRTELSLREALMRAVDRHRGGGNGGGGGAETLLQVSTWAVATAADEEEGAADAADWRHFLPKGGKADGDAAEEEEEDSDEESVAKIQWSGRANDHDLIGRVIFRPPSSPLRPAREGEDGSGVDDEKCHWYRIVSYTPSIKAVEEVTMEGGGAPTPDSGAEKDAGNLIVERRMRFRAVPVAESDIDAPHEMEDSDDDEDDLEYMVLTEAQARAGAEAAALRRRIEGIDGRGSPAARSRRSARARSQHPYRNGHGSRVMLTPLPEDDDEEEEGGDEVLYGVIAGHDTSAVGADVDAEARHRLLVLLEEDEDLRGKDAGEDDRGEVGRDGSDGTSKPSGAIWSTVDDEGAVITDIVPDAAATSQRFCSRYSIEMHEFYQGSPAYDVCESIVSYLRKHSKSGPFMQPVDPVALGIPDYPEMIKNPMDISTLAKNLEEGVYSRIPPTSKFDASEDMEDGTDTPVYRMAYGPFYDAVMLIFDNCIRFNGETSWIGNEAAILKKNAIKKMEQVVSRAVWSGQGAMASGAKKSSSGIGGASSSSLSRRAHKKSVYTEEDSDVDMYEYESEYEDEDGGGGRRRSRKGNGRAKSNSKKRSGKEDIPSRAIERPFALPDNAHEFGTVGAFPHLKVRTDIGKFSLSRDWSCRYIREDAGGEGGGECEGEGGARKGDPSSADDEMLMLLRMQQEEDNSAAVRRSSRARQAPKNYADEEVMENPAASARSYAAQAPVTLPGVEYYLLNGDIFQPREKASPDSGGKEEEGTDGVARRSKDRGEDGEEGLIPTVCRSRLDAEGIRETIHERFFARLYRERSPDALILDSGIGKYADGSFPPYLGRVVPASGGGGGAEDDDVGGDAVWEIRERYLVPALRWVLRGLVRSGHLGEADGSLTEGARDDAHAMPSFGPGTVVPSHEYYYNEGGTSASSSSFGPFDVLDEKEILRRRRQDAAAAGDGGDDGSEEEVELSEYEQMRAARVARNAERLKALGLA